MKKKKNATPKQGKFYSLVRFLLPRLTMTRPESLEAIKNLQRKLNDAHKDSKEWRDRCLSAEHTITFGIANGIKEAVGKHDEEHGTTLSWRM